MAEISGKSKKTARGSTVHPCSCSNSFQDQRYGYRRRVHNFCADGEKSRCTVCGNEKGER